MIRLVYIVATTFSIALLAFIGVFTLALKERLLNKIETGIDLDIEVPSVNFKGKAKVIRVVPIISNKTRTFKVTAQIQGDASKVLPGLFAEALIN